MDSGCVLGSSKEVWDNGRQYTAVLQDAQGRAPQLHESLADDAAVEAIAAQFSGDRLKKKARCWARSLCSISKCIDLPPSEVYPVKR